MSLDNLSNDVVELRRHPCHECERLNHEWANVIATIELFQREHRHELHAWAEQAALLDMAQWDALRVLNEHCNVHRPIRQAVAVTVNRAN